MLIWCEKLFGLDAEWLCLSRGNPLHLEVIFSPVNALLSRPQGSADADRQTNCAFMPRHRYNRCLFNF